MFRTSLVTRIHSLKLSALNKQFVSHQAFGWESKSTVSECKRRLNGKGIRNKQILVHREYPHSFLPYDAGVCKGEGEGRGRRRRKARRLKCAQLSSAWTCFSVLQSVLQTRTDSLGTGGLCVRLHAAIH